MHPVPPCVFHILPLCELYSLQLCHKGASVLIPPPPDYWHTSFWQVQIPYTESQFQRFRLVHWAVQIRFIPISSLNPPYISKCPSSFTLLVLVFFYFCLAPRKLLYRQYLFLASSHILPYILDYAIPPYSSSPFCYFLSYSPIGYGWQPLFWHVPDFILPFQLSNLSLIHI